MGRRWACNLDGNDGEIAKCLKKLGFEVINTANVGGEMLDKIAVFHGIPVFVEIKDGSLTPGHRRLTDSETKFFSKVTHLSAVVRNEQDCIKLRDMMMMISDLVSDSDIEWRYMPEEYEERL